MAAKPALKRLIEFQKLMLRFRAIKRVVYIPSGDELENDVEHSYSLAMTAWFLAPHFPKLNRDKLIRLALAHDLLEVHAGDTYVYGDKAKLASKARREKQAVEQLQREWPDFPELFEEITDYETKNTPEARFIYALDKVMPTFLGYIAKGHFWRKYKVTFQVLHTDKQPKVAVSSEITEYYEELIKLLQEHPEYFAATAQQQ